MARKKLRRFAELETMPNVIDGRKDPAGWLESRFGERPVLVELGCGRGEYTLELARSRPEAGVIGVDRNGARLWKGATRALVEGLDNAVFVRSLVEALGEHIPQERVDEIWIPFPDPLPKNRQEKHRLLAPQFLKRYRTLARPGARIHLKTDDLELLDYAVETVKTVGGRVLEREQIDGDTPPADLRQLETTYERRFRAEGRPIYYLCFCFD